MTQHQFVNLLSRSKVTVHLHRPGWSFRLIRIKLANFPDCRDVRIGSKWMVGKRFFCNGKMVRRVISKTGAYRVTSQSHQ